MSKKFIYKNYFYKIRKGNLEISFIFKMEPENIYFRPKIIIKNVPNAKINLDNLVFHLGLMEIPTYWKAAIAPEIIIEAGCLNKEQIGWWRNLIIKGMGQFFYENKIDWLKIVSKPGIVKPGILWKPGLKNRYLAPFAGGRDSIVTLESLKKKNKDIALFTVNPVAKIQKAVKVSGVKKQIIVKRKIDKKLLELNKKGYLNGHTPFTSLLSFISVLCAVLFNYKNIAFSNEKSANDGNVRYLGRIINHQWAKSSEFEKMFRNYCKKYLAKDINYFSYLRKYGELEISKMLTKYPKYFSVFSSCNAGMRMSSGGALQAKKRWCGKCPKCLFVYMSLYPLLNKEDLLKIFSKDLFENKKLLAVMKELIGEGKHKPFECVGTYKESRKAFKLSFEKAKKSGEIPYLLKRERP
ncbi:MAG: hypothetical protein HYW69_01650 [Candidatus Nealsonbacteria bacterium]|nr:hypothetical protein [Candidatus Nealsonbacteria bacterium]